jgi:hypothetical protein
MGASTTSSSGWGTLKLHVDQGDLLLEVHSSHDDDDDDKNRKKPPIRSRSRLRRRAFEEFQSGMNFTIRQCLMAIAIYLMVSIVIFSFVLEPQWTIIDSCYFAVSTFTTVGEYN